MKDITLKITGGDSCYGCRFLDEDEYYKCLLFKENLIADDWGTCYKCKSCEKVVNNVNS